MYHQRRERTTGGQWSAWSTFEAYGPASDCLDMTNAGVVAVRHGDTEIEYRQVPPEPTPAEALEALGLGRGRPTDTSTAFWRRKWADAEARTVVTREQALEQLGITNAPSSERIREALAVLDRVEALELPPKKLNHASPYTHGFHDGQRSLYRQITSNERDRA
jgi:hypothetical protein